MFYRETTPVTLTASGQEFLKRAPRLREDILDTRRATLSVTSHFAQTLRIITTNTIATSFLPDWIIRNKFSNYSLIVASHTGCLEAVRARRADMAVVARFDKGESLDGLQSEVIGDDALVLVATTKILPQIKLAKGQLSGPLMAYTPGTAYGGQIAALLKRHKIRLPERLLCESASAEALLAQVKAGLGAAWLPQMLADKSLKRCAVPVALDISYQIVLVTGQNDQRA